MGPTCPQCRASVGEESEWCPECGAELDPCRTLPPPGAKKGPPGARSPRPSPKVPKPERASRPRESPSRRSEPPSSPAPARPAAAAAPVSPPPDPYAAAAAPPPPAAPYPPPPPAQASGSGPGKLRRWLINALGGIADTPPAAGAVHPSPSSPPPYGGGPPSSYPQPYASQDPQASAAPYHHQAHAPGPGGWPPPQAAYPASAPPVPSPFLPPPGPAPIGAPPEAPPRPEQDAFYFQSTADDDEGKTRHISGVDIEKLKIPKHAYRLQILDAHGRWHDWMPIHANGLNVGRSKTSAAFPGLGSMAPRHMRFSYDGARLLVQDLDSLNGVYRRVVEPAELSDGTRFRIGGQVLEFHTVEPRTEPVSPLKSDDEEEFCSQDVQPLAVLDLIRPDGQPGLRFPITKKSPTVIGRDGPAVSLALTNDPCVSGTHAQIRCADGKFVLEDLRSTNGTFVQIPGLSIVQPGDILLAGQVLFRVVEQ